MSTRIPLGQSESDSLEFKSRDSLRNPFAIGREVVAMLNAGHGGEIWVGVEDRDGIATAIQGIDRAQEALGSLRDHLLDTIEPRPEKQDLRIEVHSEPGNGDVLHLVVGRNDRRRVFAQRKNDGLFFFERFGDRIRALSWSDVRVRASHGIPGLDREREARFGEFAELRAERQRDPQSRLWLCILPTSKLDLQLKDREQEIRDYAWDPSRTGNRKSGWTFSDIEVAAKATWSIEGDCHFRMGDAARLTTIWNDGRIEFSVLLEALHWKGEAEEIWPYPLMEFPTSVFRLVSHLYRPAKGHAEGVLADLALFGVRGWKLRPGSTRTSAFQFADPRPYLQDRDLVSDRPLVFTWDEVLETPDRCAMRLVARVYRAYGYTDEQLPTEFDRRTSKLAFPE